MEFIPYFETIFMDFLLNYALLKCTYTFTVTLYTYRERAKARKKKIGDY